MKGYRRKLHLATASKVCLIHAYPEASSKSLYLCVALCNSKFALIHEILLLGWLADWLAVASINLCGGRGGDGSRGGGGGGW